MEQQLRGLPLETARSAEIAGRAIVGETARRAADRKTAGMAEILQVLLEERWVFKLAPHLAGKAQHAYAAMTSEMTTNYVEARQIEVGKTAGGETQEYSEGSDAEEKNGISCRDKQV